MTALVSNLADVWLVRHAATSWTGARWCGRADPPLTAGGRRAAADLAIQLAEEVPPGSVVVSSPAQRARQTASPIARAARASVVVLDLLVEVDVGRAEGLTWAELGSREPLIAEAIAADGPVDWPGGESATGVAERAAAAALRLRDIASGRPVVVVSHGAFLHALAGVLAGPTERMALPPGGILRIGS